MNQQLRAWPNGSAGDPKGSVWLVNLGPAGLPRLRSAGATAGVAGGRNGGDCPDRKCVRDLSDHHPRTPARLSNVSGNFWLATLWLTWLASLMWALTRSSFSAIFTALMLSMFIFIIVPATGAQLHGNTIIAANNYQAGVIPALKIAVLAQVAMLAGAIGARTLQPAPGFDRVTSNLSAPRLDKAAVIAVTVAVLGVIGMSVIGGANLRDFFVYTTSGGYGTFWSEMHANLGFLVAVQCVGGLAIVLLPLRLSLTGSRRRALPIAVALLASLVLLGAGQRGPFIAAGSAAGRCGLRQAEEAEGSEERSC